MWRAPRPANIVQLGRTWQGYHGPKAKSYSVSASMAAPSEQLLPLFPDSEGKLVVKGSMVKAISCS